ncbi:MAG: flap endonuclease-1 [Promethearchaeota archaeon]|nr:MAG: flap endonuclease-1 [Candidatus Lokiarchaeota archaeon]
MGVKINELVKDVKRTITFENLFNKRIAIDAFNTIYQFLAIIRQPDGTPLKDYNGNVTSHLSGIFYRTINFLEHNIRPIYVYDGKPSQLKLETIADRRRVKEEAKEKMQKAQEKGDLEEARKFAQMTSKLSGDMIEESKKLLEYLGIPVIEAASEGESQSAYLVEQGDAWGCASQDYDTLLFGGERLIRNFAVSRSKKVRDTSVTLDIEYISLSKFLENLNITREQLIDMGILIGTDFFEGIKGVGQHTALDLIKKHGTIEKILENQVTIGKKEIALDLEMVNAIREIFLHPEVKKEYPKPKWNKIKYEKVEELLVEEHNFSKNRVGNALERLRKIDTSKVQTSLEKFF